MLTSHLSRSVAINWEQFKAKAQATILYDMFENYFLEILPPLPGANELTHCGLMMPYGDIDLGQHWLR